MPTPYNMAFACLDCQKSFKRISGVRRNFVYNYVLDVFMMGKVVI